MSDLNSLEARKAEARQRGFLKGPRWAVLKAGDGGRQTEEQQIALAELKTGGFATAEAYRAE